MRHLRNIQTRKLPWRVPPIFGGLWRTAPRRRLHSRPSRTRSGDIPGVLRPGDIKHEGYGPVRARSPAALLRSTLALALPVRTMSVYTSDLTAAALEERRNATPAAMVDDAQMDPAARGLTRVGNLRTRRHALSASNSRSGGKDAVRRAKLPRTLASWRRRQNASDAATPTSTGGSERC